MNLCSNSEEQSNPKLNEYRQVVDRVREAGRCDRQEIDKLDWGKPILNGNGNDSFTSLIPSNDGIPTTRARFARPAQDPDSNAHECRNPTLAKCGGEAQHLEKVGIGVLRDSRKFRRRFGRPKHLALGCSWCHWKVLET